MWAPLSNVLTEMQHFWEAESSAWFDWQGGVLFLAKVSAVSTFLPQSQTSLQYVLDSCSRGEEGNWFGNLRVTSLLFADDVVLLVLQAWCDLQFTAECEAAGMKVGSSRCEAMVLNLRVGMSLCLSWRSFSISGSCSQ